jgi:hypothetical protein
LPNPRQQLLKSRISCRADLFIQHHNGRKSFPERVRFIVLVPLFHFERLPLVPGEIVAWDQNTPKERIDEEPVALSQTSG